MGSMELLRGKHIAVLNWRDVEHPQAGGAELYLHHIARLWVEAGAKVTWFTARPPGLAPHTAIDGIDFVRVGGELTVYPRISLRLLRQKSSFDAVVDGQNGIPFFAPLFAGKGLPVVQVVHHVHQDQFDDRFSAPLAAFGRFLEGPMSRWVYGRRLAVAVSPSTRGELRRRLKVRGPIAVVPNGTATPTLAIGPRDPDPTIAVVSRVVPHKRLDLLVSAVAAVAARVPRLRVDVVGDGPALAALRELARRLGVDEVITFHGRLTDQARDEVLSRAWMTVSTSAGEGWGCSIIEAAGRGLPCLALEVPGVRDSVLDGRTGWLVQNSDDLPTALVSALEELGDVEVATEYADRCRTWASCFTWERAADLLAGALVEETGRTRRAERRTARPDIAAVVRCSPGQRWMPHAVLRATDEIVVDSDDATTMLLNGCDDLDAERVVARLGLEAASVRLADRYDLLAGPAGLPVRLESEASAVRRA